jgi:hypothetical protein
MAKAKQDNPGEIEILKLQHGRLVCRIRGITPLIYNRMSAKVRQDLLLPKGRKTTAEKASTLKHNPLVEYQRSMFTLRGGPTLLGFPAVAFKRALASAAIDMGIAKRTQVDRLVWAVGENIPVWGIPELRMDVVRSADMNKTPDIRTRATLREWACELTLAYTMPIINGTMVTNLLAGAGLIRGIGDFRQEKGAGNFGQFELVDRDDEKWNETVGLCGRDEQQKAFDEPEVYDNESEELYAWWAEEAKRRGHEVAKH